MRTLQHSRLAGWGGAVVLGAGALAGALGLARVGLEGELERLGTLNMLATLAEAGPLALAYALGAVGLGRWPARVIARGSVSERWIQVGLGLAVMLWVSHGLGVLGLLSGAGAGPRVAGWAPVVVGLVMLADQVVRGPLRPDKWAAPGWWPVVLAPALAVLVAAAVNPPGHLWASEAGGYDAMSYHLQLPKEWACGARLWPVGHNVYSYLPSFMEAAYLHLSAMAWGPSDPLDRLLGAEAVWVPACQLLHAMTAVVAAALTGRAAWTLVRGLVDEGAARALGFVAGALVLGVPWTVVTGSLAYNEGALLALTAAGVLIGAEPGLRAWARGLGCGVAVGVACGCKPTALFMAGPLVGLVMLRGAGASFAERGVWGRMIGAGAIGGVVAVVPWLVRNWMACGNPVFPFAAGVLGRGHWTAEQAERFARFHHAPPGTTVLGRFARLASAEHGLRHEQWAVVGPVLVAALVVALVWRPSHKLAAVLGLGLVVQIVCWGTLTHLESRFLLPVLPTAGMLLAVAGAAVVAWNGRARATPAVLALVPLACAAWGVSLFVSERGGTPNRLLPLGAEALTGLGPAASVAGSTEQYGRLLEVAAPVQYVNLAVRPQDRAGAGVYLLGEATPLYYLAAIGDAPAGGSAVVYHTTWDASPMAGVDPERTRVDGLHPWSRALVERGIRYVLVNYDELRRLIEESGYFDPRLSREAIDAWLEGSDLRSVRAWPREGAGPTYKRGTGQELLEIVGGAR